MQTLIRCRMTSQSLLFTTTVYTDPIPTDCYKTNDYCKYYILDGVTILANNALTESEAKLMTLRLLYEITPKFMAYIPELTDNYLKTVTFNREEIANLIASTRVGESTVTYVDSEEPQLVIKQGKDKYEVSSVWEDRDSYVVINYNQQPIIKNKVNFTNKFEVYPYLALCRFYAELGLKP